jgi:hypothetical protein
VKPATRTILLALSLLMFAAEDGGVRADSGSGEGSTVAAIEQLGARVTLDDEGKAREVYFGRVATDAGLAHLANLRNLRRLYLECAQDITDAGLSYLKDLKHLEYLSLYQTGISDAGLVHLKDLRSLRELQFAENRITDAGLAHLRSLSRLEFLELRVAGLSDAALAHLCALPKLKRLDLAGGGHLASCECLKRLPELEELWFHGTQIDAAGLEHLAGLGRLKHLVFIDASITAEQARELRRALPDTQISRSSMGNELSPE